MFIRWDFQRRKCRRFRISDWNRRNSAFQGQIKTNAESRIAIFARKIRAKSHLAPLWPMLESALEVSNQEK